MSAPLKLFYAKGACSLATRIIIHELNLPCAFESVNLQTKVTERGENFWALNPKGSVPALQINNQTMLTETPVILEFLVESCWGPNPTASFAQAPQTFAQQPGFQPQQAPAFHQQQPQHPGQPNQIQVCESLLPQAPSWKHYQIKEMLNFISCELHKNFSALFNPEIPNAIKENVFEKKIIAKLDQLDQTCCHNRYLLGNEFSLPDASMFVILSWLPKGSNLTLSRWPNLEKYYQALKQRPSIQRACEEEGLPYCNW